MFVFILIFNLLGAAVSHEETYYYYPLPRFWTNTGFCPAGEVSHESISSSLLSNEIKLNLKLIGALPNGAISHVRIHWLLELISLVEFNEHGIPKYDFENLDKLVWWLDRRDLSLGFEFMGNPSSVFTTNHSSADFLWQDLAFQIGKRYLNRLGPSRIKRWRFESWNEPDLKTYNNLHFDTEKFAAYLAALRRGLNAAGRRPLDSVHFPLHGPAGLFKSIDHHPLCWQTLSRCNEDVSKCPINVLTFHRKGSGCSRGVASGGLRLLEEIFTQFPNLSAIPVANNEADPISGWSTPRDFQADVRYAVQVVSIIFDHWRAMLNTKAMRNLHYISHDNAFLSYSPHEFDQRTLLAHFRMNNTKPMPYSQFIQKPIYAALGMMGSLGTHAADIEAVSDTIRFLKTVSENETFLSLIAISNSADGTQDRLQREIFINTTETENLSYIVEFLEYQNTDPVYVWKFYNSPSYPNRTVREAMRRSQGPKLCANGTLPHPSLFINLSLRSPWLVHIRMCAESTPPPEKPRKLQIIPLTTREILLFWMERQQPTRCVVTYQVWFQPANTTEWRDISTEWHVPFLSFHFAPKDHQIKGTYAVRSVDAFGRFSEFSKFKDNM